MADLTRDERRINRKHVLEALHDETGSHGGDVAAPRVRAYVADPIGASTEDYAYVGSLTLRRFYVDPTKPNQNERRSLWMNVRQRFGKQATDPGGWGGTANVRRIQFMMEEA